MIRPIFLEKQINTTKEKVNIEDIKLQKKGAIQTATDSCFLQDKNYFFSLKRELLLDRINGTFTLPNFIFLKLKRIKFSQIQAFIKILGIPDDYGGESILKLYVKGKYDNFKYQLKIVHSQKHITFKNFQSEISDIKSYWSFMVWYMDKNRPLPSGTAFDPYRQRDFERRKAEGFPKPLYPSNTPTPEATPEQQMERKKIGGW